MSRQERLVLVVGILASFIAFLDGSIVNVALPAISRDLGGGLAAQQWIVDAYLITLGALILVAGSLSDLFGRKKVLQAGLIGFGVTSILCAIAPTSSVLIVARALQGVAGALLVPSSLALIMSTFSGPKQGKAVGSWTAWTGIAFIVGPLLGGLLVNIASWRLVFAINILPIAVTLWLMQALTQAEQIKQNAHVDYIGTVLAAVGLGGPVYALIEQPHYGWSSPAIYLPLVIGLVALGYFFWYERRTKYPMLPLDVFTVRNFSVGNVATTAIYSALAIATFLVTIFIQQVAGYSPVAAGMALIPVTLIMFFLSPRIGALSSTHGPRWFMGLGPLVAALGFLYMLRMDQHISYWADLFPGVVLFGLGLSITVAPLTAAILGSIDSKQAGVASAINNAVARIAGLLGIAALGLLTGSRLGVAGFHRGLIAIAVLMIIGGVVSAIGIQNPARARE